MSTFYTRPDQRCCYMVSVYKYMRYLILQELNIQDVRGSKMALRLSRSKPMEEGHKNLLISNMAILIEDLELSKLLPYMTPALDDEDFATIRSLPTKSEQVEMLVTILPERGDKAFHCFIQNLKIAQPDLVDRMFNKSGEVFRVEYFFLYPFVNFFYPIVM